MERVLAMTLTVFNLKERKEQKFTELFERIFPHGVKIEKMRTMKEYRLAVRAQIFRFACNEKFYIRCSCEVCEQDSYFSVWHIAETLAAQSSLSCCCGQGHFVPVYRETTKTPQAG